MIDKLLLNNQIITNKKKIQQARIQAINKLVQKIRKFKILNEKKPQNARITNNLIKIPHIIGCLKKIKVFDIIRKILTFNKKFNAILTNGQAPPEDVAIALLATNKILADFVDTLRNVLTLDDTNPGWQSEIMEISKRKKRILENGSRKKLKTLKKPNKMELRVLKKLPWKEEDLENSQEAKLEGESSALVNKWKVEPITSTTEELTKKTNKNKPKKDVAESKPFSLEESLPVTKTDVITPKLSPSKKPSLSVNSEKVVNKFKKKLPPPKILLSAEEHENTMEEISHKPVTTVDSFFFTNTGDNYLSTVVIDRVQPEPIQDGLVRRERRGNTMRPNKRNNFGRHSMAENSLDKRRQPNQSYSQNKRQSFVTKSKVQAQQPQNDEKLHPSWAAKQKLKPIITQFKGQKITFDDEGKDTSSKSSKQLNSKEAYHHHEKAVGQSQENIHPSWAAKQKLKPTITEFKGTKITFDD